MATRPRPRSVLQVSRNEAGYVEMTLSTESEPSQEIQRFVIGSQDVVVLIEMLRRCIEEVDPEDRSTFRNLRPVP